jgi:hypothetical protein
MAGNVTTISDNATINNTSVENTGFAFMANETQSLKMLATYNAEYVLVFVTLRIEQSQSGGYYAVFAGYGDEGKWTWMARISGEAENRLINESFMDPNTVGGSWTDETTFGAYNSTTGLWDWNNVGTNSTIYKLMTWGEQEWCNQNGVTPYDNCVQPTYFDEAYFAGLTDSGSNYGGLIPLVCLYKIDWTKYYSSLG